MRLAGVLAPISMLNGNYGIGDFGESAYEFVDIISDMGFKLWQILPLNPVGYGNSPYQPYSSYAGDEIYIDLEQLYTLKLIKYKPVCVKQTEFIDYIQIRNYKNAYLKEAFKQFTKNLNDIKSSNDNYDTEHVEFYHQFDNFIQNHLIYNYAVFASFKKHFNGVCWNNWDKEYRNWAIQKSNNNFDLTPHIDEINYQLFIQYIFYNQWMSLKKYVNEKGIKIAGDIPIYVGYDSADVWQNKNVFLLNRYDKPSFVAGVPPDYFNANGQRWGNPLYDWDYLSGSDFQYWIERLSYNNELYDIIRIDHFRAFDTYWKINAKNKTARKGEWVEAPGYALFNTIFKQLPEIEIIAEDLGELREEVHKLRDAYDLMGMNIMQFTFNPEELADKYNTKKHVVLYTGTHDNQTIKGYFNAQSSVRQRKIINLLERCGAKNVQSEDIHQAYLKVMFDNIADYAIVPVQDILGLGDESRLNYPGSVDDKNWSYKLTDLVQLRQMTDTIRIMLTESNRC